ncbi:MAG TPA: class A beta-lactamase [Pyrinomonadaceae bacterium]|nr:class A beta-lactamase [Pyrinomonadaceae bacterium]
MKMMVVKIGIISLALAVLFACSRERVLTSSPNQSPATNGSPITPQAADVELTKQLATLCNAIDGNVAATVVHVESGRTIELEGARKLPLYSVFKLPLAVAVLEKVEDKSVSLDQKVSVTAEDVAPGLQFNTDLWRQPVEKTVSELLEYSIVRSDNTSSDKLLQLVGGPAVVTQRMRALGLSGIDIVSTVREYSVKQDKPNLGTSADLARLLLRLQKGEVLQPPGLSLLLGFMERARTGGERRLRANLPAGTQVSDKTGTGADATNDVGLITLPDGSHLAIAVLINGSKSTTETQEELIAELARTAYDSFVASSTASDGR